MSYSFHIRAATKAEAKAKCAAELDKVVQHQPSHAVDREQALAAAGTFIDLLPDDTSKDVTVSMHGSVGGTWAGAGELSALTSVNVGVSAGLVVKAAG